MTAPVFVDTNVLIYAIDLADPRKQRLAQTWMDELWKNKRGRLSYQVLQEFYAKVSRKELSTAAEARAVVRDLLVWRPVAVEARIVERAWMIQDRYMISFWDALIVAAANACACCFLLTEDMQEGQTLEDVRVINPFTTDPDSII